MSDADEFLKKYLENIRNQYNGSGFPPKYASGTMRTVTVSCRDGVELTTDIYTPVMKGPYPTIVVRCPTRSKSIYGGCMVKSLLNAVMPWYANGVVAPIHPANMGAEYQ